MKPHDDIEFQLSQLLDGQLSVREAQALRRRMEQEPALAEQFRQYQALQGELGALGPAELPVDLAFQRESIQAALERESLMAPERPAWSARLARWSALGAAAAAAVVLVVLGLQWLQGPPAPSAELAGAMVEPAPHANGTLEAGLVVPARARAGELVAAFRPATLAQSAPAGMPSALAGGPDVVGTVVVSVGAPRPTPTNGMGFWLMDLR